MKDKFDDKSDFDLVKLSIDDPNVYVHLMKRYEQRLLRYIHRISNFTKEDAEDVLQEVFLNVYQNLNSYNPTFKFSSWIYRITHNKTINYYKKKKSRPVTLDLEDKEILDVIMLDKDIALDVVEAVSREHLVKAIGELEPKYKSVLVLRYLEGKEYSEISDILRMPVNTVGTLINRAKQILKKKLN